MRSLLDRMPAAMITPGATVRTRTVVLVTVPVLLTVALALLWYRSQRVLGLDAFYYVEYTKELAGGWPTVFGSNWPRGYPLLAALAVRLGLSPFLALVAVSTATLLAMTVAAANLLPRELRWSWTAFVVFCALCAAPSVPLLLGMPMSEITFAAFLLLSVYFVRHWPSKGAIWLTLFFGFGSFCIRYAGIFVFGLIAVLLVLHFDELRHRKHLAFSGGWFAFFAGVTGLLLWSNIQVTGHISGADRGFGGGLAVVPEQIAHLGWSAIGMISSSQLDELIGGVASVPGLVVGWTVMAAVAAFCVRAAIAPKEPMARALALLVLAYLGSFVAMRALRSFPDINEPRYFVPVLFPLALVVLLEIRLQARRAAACAAAAVVLIGCAMAFRGVSEETYGDVAFARETLEAMVGPSDVVRVNAAALSLAAYFPNRFVWDRCGLAEVTAEADLIVVAGRRSGRGASTSELDACGRRLVDLARRDGYEIRRSDGPSLVLQRRGTLATTFSETLEN